MSLDKPKKGWTSLPLQRCGICKKKGETVNLKEAKDKNLNIVRFSHGGMWLCDDCAKIKRKQLKKDMMNINNPREWEYMHHLI